MKLMFFKSSFKSSVVLLGCVFLSLICQAEDITPDGQLNGFLGVWYGQGIQDNNSSWTIKITLTAKQYLVEYPSLKCGGKLQLIKKEANILIFNEHLTYGLDCYNNGKTVLIKSDNNTLRYYWYFENGGRKAAVGLLSKENAKSIQHVVN